MDTVELQHAEPDVPAELDTAVGGPEKEVVPEEQALVAAFNATVKVPSFLQTWYEQFAIDRKYVNEDALMIDDEDVVSTNYVFRNQIILLANLYARDPAISWKQGPMVGDPPLHLSDFGKTLEIFCKKMADETEMRRILRTGIQEASGLGWAIFKLVVQEDYKRDAIGARRQDDQLDNLARLQWLQKRMESGQFNKGDALWQQLQDCQKTVAQYLHDQMMADLINNPPASVPPPIDPMTGMPQTDPVTGEPLTHSLDMEDPRLAQVEALKQGQIPENFDVPEIARYLGLSLEMIQQEDFRFDWTIGRTVDLYKGQSMSHRVFMDYDTFGSRFDVTPEEIGNIVIYGPDGRQLSADKRWTRAGAVSASQSDSEGPTDRKTMETNANMGRCAVWERWDKAQGRVYVWVEGMPRFLQNYVPEHTGRRWYPFYILHFNPTVGRPIPISDTMLTRSLQDELNRRRTQEAEAQKACFPKILIAKGTMNDEEKRKYENANPYEVVELEHATDVAKAVFETKPLPFNGELYARAETRLEFEMMSGVSRNAAGSGSSDGELATTASVANEQMGVQVDFRKAMLEEVIFDIMYDFAFIGVQVFPEETILSKCGPGAYWPLLNREQMLYHLQLTVRAGSSGRPDSEKRLALFEQLAAIAAPLGLPLNGEAVLEEIMHEMDVNDWKRFIMTPEQQLLKQLTMPPGAQPGAQAPPGGAPQGSLPRGNAAQPNPTPGSGAPTYAQKGPPAPNAIPGPK